MHNESTGTQHPETPKHNKILENIENEEDSTKQSLQEQLTAVSQILDDYPRTNEWIVSENKDYKKSKPKNRYSLNAFGTVLGRAQLVTEALEQGGYDTDLIDDMSKNILEKVKAIKENTHKLGSEYLDKIPSDIATKYSQMQPAWLIMIITRGAYHLATQELIEIKSIDPENAERIKEIQTEAENDFVPLHEAYKEDLKNPKNGCAITDEMVDDLEQLVNTMQLTLVEALNKTKEENRLAA